MFQLSLCVVALFHRLGKEWGKKTKQMGGGREREIPAAVSFALGVRSRTEHLCLLWRHEPHRQRLRVFVYFFPASNRAQLFNKYVLRTGDDHRRSRKGVTVHLQEGVRLLS